MESEYRLKDILVIGFALFAMFFGSGNLIFPSYLGRQIGMAYWIGFLGFMITGIGLPLLSVMATAKADGEFSSISGQVGKGFSIVLMTALILTIGPLLAIPRTAATTYEIGIRPFFPKINSLVVIIVYFIVNLILVLRPAAIVDVIGRVLTPILLVILLVLIIKGAINPIGPITTASIEQIFSSSMIEGYQTMDALGAVCFGSIIVKSIKDKGYTKPKELMTATLEAAGIAIIGLGVIYGGLMYLGANTGHIIGKIEKTALITVIAKEVLGEAGSFCLAVAVTLACLTTSIGLTITAAHYFSDLSKGKCSYTLTACIISAISILIASMGVDRIVGITGPILNILYPVIIVLVLVSLIKNQPTARNYQWPVYVTLIIAILEESIKLFDGFNLQSILAWIPLSSSGFGWLLPAIIAYLVSEIKSDALKSE